jgi:hypothetical protein
MNERIQDLIKQMDKACLPYGNNAMTITDVDLEYFAKLIIQQCAAYIDSSISDGGIDGRSLKQHFGFKE